MQNLCRIPAIFLVALVLSTAAAPVANVPITSIHSQNAADVSNLSFTGQSYPMANAIAIKPDHLTFTTANNNQHALSAKQLLRQKLWTIAVDALCAIKARSRHSGTDAAACFNGSTA